MIVSKKITLFFDEVCSQDTWEIEKKNKNFRCSNIKSCTEIYISVKCQVKSRYVYVCIYLCVYLETFWELIATRGSWTAMYACQIDIVDQFPSFSLIYQPRTKEATAIWQRSKWWPEESCIYFTNWQRLMFNKFRSSLRNGYWDLNYSNTKNIKLRANQRKNNNKCKTLALQTNKYSVGHKSIFLSALKFVWFREQSKQ